ncbi:MAG: glycosyltransferase family 4 protein [Actinobacteria bacterium]|nr:glycosyltransferase family 4 protein [Actinomycetota bacterium]
MSSPATETGGDRATTDPELHLRLLVCTPKYAPQVGGAETWLRALLEAMSARSHDVSVIARAAAEADEDHVAGGIPVHRVRGGRVAFARAIGAGIRRARPDAVLAQYSALAPATWAAHRAGVPTVGIVHDVYGWRESWRIKGPLTGTARHVGLERSLRWLRPDAFLVNSRATARRLGPLAGDRPVTVVPAGADHLPARHGGASAQDSDRVVFVGRLVKQKGAADLLDAVAMLHSEGVAVRAVVIGSGPQEPALRELAGPLGASITFAGRVSDAELDEAIRGAAVLVLPSTREGWGLAITEAAARGVPYVAYDIPAVGEQHDALQGGVLVEPSPRALAGAMRRLLDDPGERRRLGETGAANAANLRWSNAAEVAGSAIARVVHASPSRRPR